MTRRPAPGGEELGRRLREGDLSAAPAVLNLVESSSPAHREAIAALMEGVPPAALGREAPAHVVGVTGPPGVGKSSLLSELVRAWRAEDRAVAVLAVDPSSKRSGGALLGDRARIVVDPADRAVFIRSMAAGGRLGGLAPATRAAAHALAAAFDVVVIETVGVGQSETEIAEVGGRVLRGRILPAIASIMASDSATGSATVARSRKPEDSASGDVAGDFGDDNEGGPNDGDTDAAGGNPGGSS